MKIVWIVAKREFLDIVSTRGYWITVILFPVILGAAPFIGFSVTGAELFVDPEEVTSVFQEAGRRFAPMLFFFVMFAILMQGVQYLLSNTIEEKSNRVLEMLISSITPDELMRGKLLGIGIASFLSMGFLLLSMYVFLYALFSFLTDDAFGVLSTILGDVVGFELLPWILFYLFTVYALYSGIFLATGALCNNYKEAQGLMIPVVFLTMLPMFVLPLITIGIMEGVTRALSWVPLFTPYLMLGRMMSGDIPLIDVIGTTALLIASIYAVLWLSARVFRYGVLRTGQPPKFVEILRSIRSS